MPMLNDYTFLSDAAKANDNLWVHRSKRKWKAAEDLTDGGVSIYVDRYYPHRCIKKDGQLRRLNKP